MGKTVSKIALLFDSLSALQWSRSIWVFGFSLLTSMWLIGCGQEGQLITEATAAFSKRLKDPSSLQLRNMIAADNQTLCGEFNSKNANGGYVGFTTFIYSRGVVPYAFDRDTGFVSQNFILNPEPDIFQALCNKSEHDEKIKSTKIMILKNAISIAEGGYNLCPAETQDVEDFKKEIAKEKDAFKARLMETTLSIKEYGMSRACEESKRKTIYKNKLNAALASLN